MEFFRNLTIAKKLGIAFTVTTLATLALGGFAIAQINAANAQLQAVSTRYMPAVQRLDSIRTHLAEYRIAELSMLSHLDDAAQVAQFTAAMETQHAQIGQDQATYQALPSTDEQKQRYTALTGAMAAYFDAHNRLAQAVANGDVALANSISANDSAPRRRELFHAVEALNEYVGNTLATRVAQANTSASRADAAIAVFMVLLAALSIGLAIVIVRSIVGPVTEAVRVADDVASGRLDRVINLQRKDEVGHLLRSMSSMQGQLKAIIAAQSDMTRRHDAGQISYRIDDAAFPGDYGQMVRETNALVSHHIEVKLRLVEVMRRYATGDLTLDMEQLPGESAVITEAMHTTKANLSAINAEIKRLAHAAAAGDFSQRGDEGRFDHDFRDMVGGLNGLMQSTEDNLSKLSSLLQAIADGDLTRTLDSQCQGVFAQMRDDANRTVAELARIIGNIQHATGGINLAASEIATGNNDLSQRTEQQAANLEETAASMEELTSTVRQNAEHARQANQLAMGAQNVAEHGGTVVHQVVATMSAIEHSSKKIADIITVIDGIAFQTNILALNAAVEAARAGEQGRGFAVVASEVRTLAQRSAGAAKEIKSLIDDSVQRVAEGSDLVGKAGTTMDEIVQAVQRVTGIMAEISAASQEQSSGIEQVNQTVVHMDEATQQNAALVEEATAAARSMEEQAKQLADAVARFRLTASDKPAAAGAAPRPSPTAAPTTPKRAAVTKPAVRSAVTSTPTTAAAETEWAEF